MRQFVSKTESKSLFHIYIFLWIVYSLNGIFFEPSGFIPRITLLFILVISIYNALWANMMVKLPPYVKGLNLLVLIFTIYGVLFIFDPQTIFKKEGDAIIHYVYLKTIYMSLLPFYSFYRFSLNGSLNHDSILKLLPVFIIIVLIKYVEIIFKYQVKFDDGGITNNTGYQFVSFLPYVFLLDKKKPLQFILLFFLIIMCFASVKRGAIIIALLFTGWFLYSRMKFSQSRNNGRVLFIVIIAIVGLYILFQYFLLNNAYFESRFEKTVGGDHEELRSVMYTYMFNWFLHSNTTEGFLFGNGPYTSVKIMGEFAHNDWLEIALALGSVGIFSYLYYWYSLIKTSKVVKKVNNQAYCITVSFLLIYFMKTWFSMSYENMPITATMILALAIATSSNNKKQYYNGYKKH